MVENTMSKPTSTPLRIGMSRDLSLGLEKAGSLPDMMLIISAGLHELREC